MNRPAFDWMLVGVLTALSGVVGLYGVFYLPAYSGSVPLPLVIIPVGVVLVLLPRVTYRLTRRMLAADLPVLVWFVVTVWLYLAQPSLYPNASVAWRAGWQFMALLGVGVLGAAASIGMLWGDHLRDQIRARSAPPSGTRGSMSSNVTVDTVQRPPGDGGY